MDALTDLSFPLAALACFGLTVLSAIVPWVNAEIIVLSLPAVAGSPASLAGLVIVATVGQMAGKCIVYWAARSGGRLPSPRVSAHLERWQARLVSGRSSPLALVLFSSVVGVPPFYVMTLLAGLLKVSFPRYLAAGTVGRLVRFGSLVLVPQALAGLAR